MRCHPTRIFPTVLLLLSAAATGSAQTQAVVPEVTEAAAARFPSPSGAEGLIVAAKGFVPDTEWRHAKLVPYVYVTPPADGVWDFTFVAERSDGPSLALTRPIYAFEFLPEAPDWVRGVRIHASLNNQTVALSGYEQLSLSAPGIPQFLPVPTRGDIEFDLEYEDGGDKHCLVGKVKVKVAGISKTWRLGRVCIAKNATCISGDKDVGGDVSVHWKLCIEDGPKLCLRVKACYDPPIGGDICTGWKEVCVSID